MFWFPQCAMLFPEAGQIRTRAAAGVKNRIGGIGMKQATGNLICRATHGAAWVMCPLCRHGKVLKLTEETRAWGLVLFCRNCKHECVVDIVPADGYAQRFPRVIPTNQAATTAMKTR